MRNVHKIIVLTFYQIYDILCKRNSCNLLRNNKFMKKTFLSMVTILAFAMILPQSALAGFDAQCSSDYNGKSFSEKPEISSSLCETGSPSGTIEGDGSLSSPWKWHCFDHDGTQGEKCEAFKEVEVEAAPLSCDVTASETVIIESGSTTLSWDTENADKVSLHPCNSTSYFKTGGPSGSHTITGVDSSRCYAVTAYGAEGSKTCTVDITVNEKPEEIVEEEEVVEEVQEETNTVVDPGGDSTPTQETTTPEVQEQKTAPVATTDEDEDDNDEFVPAAACSVEDYSNIKGKIWHDDNRNGKKDAGEKYLDNVTVELLDADGNEIEEDETNTEGQFKFENYAPGKYTIDVKSSDRELEGMHVVYEPDNNLNGKDQITLKCDNNHTGTSFGYDDGSRDAQGTNRPSTLSQTGGSIWSAIKAFFIR